MNLLSVLNLSKTVHDVPLFAHVDFGLDEGEHVGLVGRNGVGKSTLLSILAGTAAPDEGTVSLRRDSDTVMLSQIVTFAPEDTIDSFLFEGMGKRIAIRRKYQENIHDEAKLASLETELHATDAWNLENDYHTLLGELGISDFSAKMDILSGGQLKKIAIARVLAAKADLILLDEPTNHLDIQTITWLENQVKSSPKTIIFVTHDRYFLNAVATSILELAEGTIHFHPGSFSAYLERREERLSMDQKAQERLKVILRRELAWMQRGARARSTKATGRIERIEEMQSSLHTVGEEKQRQFASQERRLGKKILHMENVSKAYGNKVLFDDFTYDFLDGDHIGLIGPNGSGKSTLLDIIMGITEPDSGIIGRGVNTVFAYYDQQSKTLPEGKTITEYITDKAERIRLSKDEIVSPGRFLELFGFPEVMQRQTISRLSGGERRRLYLVCKLLDNPNFLLLDEPTNDLDLETMENLEQYLADFSGCALIVSHDRAFLDQCCDKLFILGGESGSVSAFPGCFSDYQKAEEAEEREKKEETKKQQEPARRHAEKKGLSFKEQKEYEELTKQLEALESQQKALEESFSVAAPTTLGTLQERNAAYEKNKLLQSQLEERWFILEEKAEGN